jgi:hypothetical protein
MKAFLKINNRVICAKASRHFWRLASATYDSVGAAAFT